MIGLLIITILINSKLNRNYIRKSFLDKIKIIINLKRQFYKLEVINRININIRGKVIKKIFIKLDLKKYSKKIILDMIE